MSGVRPPAAHDPVETASREESASAHRRLSTARRSVATDGVRVRGASTPICPWYRSSSVHTVRSVAAPCESSAGYRVRRV